MIKSQLLGVLSLLAAAGAAVAQPQFISIAGTPSDMSADGTVVVGSNGGVFRWVRTGNAVTYTILNPNTAGGGNAACSADGSIVAGAMINTSENFGPLGFSVAGRWTSATGFSEQHDLFAFSGTGSPNTINVARNVTRDGRYIVGFGYANSAIGGNRPMIHDTQTGVGRNPGGIANPAARIICVSDDATVLGGDDDITGSAQRPAIWRLDSMTGNYVGQILEPGTGGVGSSTISVISADGSKAAGFSRFDNTKLVRFEYDAGTGLYNKVILATALTPAGTALTRVEATAMTPDGETIFGRYNNARAFIWTAATGMRDLTNDLVAEGITGLPSPTTVIGNVTGCSDNGRAICGPGGLGASSFVILRDGEAGCVVPVSVPTSSTTQVSACTTSIIINASAIGTGPFTYQHRKDGVPLNVPFDTNVPTGNVNANGVASVYRIDSFAPSQLRVNNAGPADAGSYDVIISNGCGDVTTTPRVVDALAPGLYDTCETAAEASGIGGFGFEMCGAYVNEAPASCGPATQRADVWIRYTPLSTGDIRISTCAGSNFDTVLSTFDTCGGTQTACSNDFCGSRASLERISVTQGVPFLIRLGVGSAVPTAQVQITIDQLDPPPANDLCANATPITGSGSFFIDNTLAGNDGVSTCVTAGGSQLGKDVWFRYTAPSAGTLHLDTCGVTANTVLSVHDTCGGTQLACNDNSNINPNCTFQSNIDGLVLTSGQSVLVRVAGNSLSLVVTGNLNVAFTPAPCPLDFNNDGITEPGDLDDFITAFFSELAAERDLCDFNDDGLVEPGDLDDFITAFFEGC